MKEYTITQSYALTLSVTVHVPDDMTIYEIQEHFADYDISVTVEPDEEAWDEWNADSEVICDHDICVDSLAPHGFPLVYKDGELQGSHF